MRYGIVGDVHGRDLKAVEKEFSVRKVDYGICLGDFDRAHLARQMKEMQERGNWYVVPGNHDDAHVRKIPIRSGKMTSQGISSQMMWQEWDSPENRDVNAYAKTLLACGPPRKNCGRKLEIGIDGERAVIIHGALAGSYQGEPADLWTRLDSDDASEKEANHAANFREMEKNGYQMMIRGHDHDPDYTYRDPVKGIKSYSGANDAKFRLFRHRLHTISPGAFFDGLFATIDTELPGTDCPILSYHKIGV